MTHLLQSLDRHMAVTSSFKSFVKDYDTYSESNADLIIMTFVEFIKQYNSYFEYDGSSLVDGLPTMSRYQIYLLVDISTIKTHTMNQAMKKKYRKSGKIRRLKLNEKFNYETNVCNRIHGYVCVEDSPGLSDEKTLAINIICSSNYSDIKGVGSYIMKSIIESATKVGYNQLVLEVGSTEMEEKDTEEEDTEEEDTEEEDTEEEDELEYIRDDFCVYMADNLWKKSIRHNNGVPYYSFNEEYLLSIIFDTIKNKKTEQDIPIIIEDDEYGYYGYYYHKAKRHSYKLIQYYNKIGFVEDPSIHIDMKCFSELPFPSMKLGL